MGLNNYACVAANRFSIVSRPTFPFFALQCLVFDTVCFSLVGQVLLSFLLSYRPARFIQLEKQNKDIKAGIATCRKTLAAIAIRAYSVENALPKKCQANLLVDLVKQVFTTLNLKYPTVLVVKNDIHTAERAKDTAAMAAKNSRPSSGRGTFPIQKPQRETLQIPASRMTIHQVFLLQNGSRKYC